MRWRYERRGYDIWRGCLSLEFVAGLRERAVAKRCSIGDTPGDVRKTILHRLMRLPFPSVGVTMNLLDMNSVQWFSSRYFNNPWSTSHRWHRDSAVVGPVITIPLTTWTRENGATEMIPYSHINPWTKRVYVATHPDVDPAQYDTMRAVQHMHNKRIYDRHIYEEIVHSPSLVEYATMKPGDMLIMHPRVLHRRGKLATEPVSDRNGLILFHNPPFL